MSYEVVVKRFFTIPLKRSNDVNLITPLETFIKNTYGKNDEDLNKRIKEFHELRRTAASKSLDKSVSSLNNLFQYHDQLVAASYKIPFKESNGAHITFTWKDSLQKGKFLSSTPKLSIVDGDFERLCVLFNIGALMSQMGNEANFNSHDGLKIAAKYFQESAGIFAHIKDHIMSVAGEQTLTSDLTPEVLNAFSCIMTAQAQECFYDKANSDPTLQRKPEMLAKVAMQASYLYGESAKAFNVGEVNHSLLPVLTQCNAKKDLFECRAQHHQAKLANDGKQFGEAIARYQLIEPLLKALIKSSSDVLSDFNGKQLLATIVSEKEAAAKDNNFIYHDVVPKPSQLSPIGKAVIAKAKSYNPEDHLSASFTDIFSAVVPLTIHSALESFENRRKELVEKQVESLREQNTLLNGMMSSLNLPAALEDMSGNEIPSSILEKSMLVISKGGVAPIEQLLQELPDALSRNQDLLTETLRILNNEQSSDTELREKFGDKWKRKPSSELTSSLRQEASKYQTIIENAQNADRMIKEKYEENREGIAMLCLPEVQLKQAVPSASPIGALQDHEVVQELRHLCEQAATLKAEREVIESELKTTPCDMTEKFTKALAEDGSLREDSLSPAELDTIYQPLIEQMNESFQKQESLLANIQRANDQFTELKQQTAAATTREDVLKKMAVAFDRFQELSAHLQEGSKFYGDLTELLLKLQGKCSDLVFARKTEKEELLKDVQQTILSSSSSVSTSTPSGQKHSTKTTNPPPRPPPPKPQEAPSGPSPSETVPATVAPTPAPRRLNPPSTTVPALPISASAPPSSPVAPPTSSTAPPTSATAPPTSTIAPPTTASTSSAPVSQTQTGQYPAYQQPPYGYGPSPPQGYHPYPGGYGAPPAQSPYPTQAPYPGYSTQQFGVTPYPRQTPPGGAAYPQQSHPAYPTQPQQAGYPGYPQQGYGAYGQQPPYYYPPQQ